MKPRHSFFALLTLLALVGCGSKSGLKVPPPSDAGIDTLDTFMPDTMDPPDTFVPPDTDPPVDECIELPIDEPPEFVDVSFLARISRADVLFLVDVTGSMSDEIDQIRESLRSVIVPEMVRTIPDVNISVASLADFKVSPYGSMDDDPFILFQRSTSNIDDVQLAIDRLDPTNGGDGPESQIEALYQSATGEGRGVHVTPSRCPASTIGYPCFRAGGSPIILLFTDAEFHNGPGGSFPYEGISPTPATYTETVNALQGIGAKVLGLFSGFGDGGEALSHLRSIARDTGAVTPDGEPIVVDIGSRGERLDRGVIDVVSRLVDEVPIDIDAIVEDWPGDDLDAREFVTEIEARRARPADGAINRGDRFDTVTPGTEVFFRIHLANDRIEAGDEPIIYYLTIVLRGDGVTPLRERTVQVVIPSRRGDGCEDL